MGKVIDVDEELYKGISSEINALAGKLSGVKSNLTPCFSGELETYYNGNCNSEISSEVDEAVTQIENTSLAINASIDAYKNTDEELTFGLDALIDELFEANMEITEEDYNPDDNTTSKLSIEEREEYLNNIINSYEETLRTLENEFNEKYGRGTVPYNSKDFKDVFPILYGMGFDVLDLSKYDNTGRISIDTLNDIITFCEKEKVFERTIDYLNGGSYKDTIGKIDFEDGLQNYEYSESDWQEDELEFLRRVASCYDVNLNDTQELENYKLMIKDMLLKDNILRQSPDGKLEFSNLNLLVDGKKELAEYEKCVNDIQTLKATIYNYKQAKELLVLEYLNDDEFKEFFNGEFSNDNLLQKYKGIIGDKAKHLTKEQIALYAFLLEKKSSDKANSFLKALDDQINSAIGLEQAIEYINSHFEGGNDLGDILSIILNGTYDGIVGFVEGFGKLLDPTKARTSTDYKVYYLIEILSNPEKYKDCGLKNIQLSDADRSLLRKIYKVSNGVGNMLIPQAVGLAGMVTGNPLIASICQKVSSVMIGASAAGRGANEAYLNGADLLHSYLYGGLSGASEALFEKLGGVLGIGSNVNLSGFMGIVSSLFKEGAEEFFQEYFDAGLRAIILNEEFNLENVTKDAFVAGLYGMAVAGVMNTNTKILIKIGTKVYTIASSILQNINLDFITDENLISVLEDLELETISEDIRIIEENNLNDFDSILDYINSNNLSQQDANSLLNAAIELMTEGCKNDSEVIVKLYSELTKLLHYDESFDMVRDSSRIESDLTLLGLNGKDIICTEFSTIFADLLYRAGIDEKNIKIMRQGKGGHGWIQVRLSDGRVLIADATNSVNGRIDLTSGKAGLDFVGLVILDSKYAGISIRDLYLSMIGQNPDASLNTPEFRAKAREILDAGYLNIKEIVAELGDLNIGEYDVVASLVEDSDSLTIKEKMKLINDIKSQVDLSSIEWLQIIRKIFNNSEIINSKHEKGTKNSWAEIKDLSTNPPTYYRIEIKDGKVQIMYKQGD